ncbi:MAG: hypothetical protein AB7G37_04195 [Solirubrobacteraceae bacterium]
MRPSTDTRGAAVETDDLTVDLASAPAVATPDESVTTATTATTAMVARRRGVGSTAYMTP